MGFCRSCFPQHRGTAPNVCWAFDDRGAAVRALVSPLTRGSTTVSKWSGQLCLDDAMEELDAVRNGKAIAVQVYVEGQLTEEKKFANPDAANVWLTAYRQED